MSDHPPPGRATGADVRTLFVEGAEAVLAAIASEAVGAAWGAPSALEHQSVGGLAGHVARGGVWVVGDYLDGPAPSGPPTVLSTAAYYALVADRLDDRGHAEIRQRGAEVGSMGQDALAAELRTRIGSLRTRLVGEAPDRLVAVAGGSIIARLDDYLATRLVEQVVHLDDLARSVGVDGFAVPAGAVELVLATGAGIGARRFGATAMLRSLYRGAVDGAAALPVL